MQEALPEALFVEEAAVGKVTVKVLDEGVVLTSNKFVKSAAVVPVGGVNAVNFTILPTDKP